MYAAGFYTYSIFALIFWETRRSDFGVSMSHHVATVILIVLSYILRYYGPGFSVVILQVKIYEVRFCSDFLGDKAFRFGGVYESSCCYCYSHFGNI